MRDRPYRWIRHQVKQHGIEGRVLDIGSGMDPRDEHLNLKNLFDPIRYVGFDIEPGHNVDVVGDARKLTETFALSSFDCVCCCNILEHVKEFWRIIQSAFEVLRVGGWLFIVVPSFGEGEHAHPDDFYRFDMDCVRSFFQGFLNVELLEDDARFRCVGGVGQKPWAIMQPQPYEFFFRGSYARQVIPWRTNADARRAHHGLESSTTD